MPRILRAARASLGGAATALLAVRATPAQLPDLQPPPLQTIGAPARAVPARTIAGVTTRPVPLEERLDCADRPVPAATRDSLLAAITAARATWVRTRPPVARYLVSVVSGMVATPAYEVTLAGDSVVAPPPAARPASASLGPEWLFASAERAALTPAGRVALTFDPRHGLPTLIAVNPTRCVTDSGTEIRVSGFSAAAARAR
jgi:hypothetical protein